MAPVSRIIIYRAKCANCPAPLDLHFGKWSHHWLYRNACHDPDPYDATQDGKPIDPHTLRLIDDE